MDFFLFFMYELCEVLFLTKNWFDQGALLHSSAVNIKAETLQKIGGGLCC